jgi:hypothetical protein
MAGERGWHPFDLPLVGYAGQRVTLTFSSSARGNLRSAWALFQYLRIDVHLDTSKPSSQPALPHFVSSFSTRDIDLHPRDPARWQITGMQALNIGKHFDGSWAISTNDFMQYNDSLDLCLADYSHIAVRMAASPGIVPRAMQIFPQLDRQLELVGPERSYAPEITAPVLPLLADGGMDVRSFTCELRVHKA